MRSKPVIAIATFVAFFAVVIAVFVGYIASLGIRVAPPAKRTNLSMDVADINNIVVDSNVLLRGVPVGKVTRHRARQRLLQRFISTSTSIPSSRR